MFSSLSSKIWDKTFCIGGKLEHIGSVRKLIQVRTNYPQRKLWTSGRALVSRSKGRGFNPCPMLDGSGVKAMPGSILTPNSGLS